ncbi:hypothetical protein VTN02DRAFT_3482 [Thermoascus thermophilus]
MSSPVEAAEKQPLVSATEIHDAAEPRRRVRHDADVVIVGAGVLGCALAVALGRQGRRVLLLERSLKEPDRIVGELLQPGGVRALEQLGLSECLEDIDSIRVKGYDVIYYGEQVAIPYPPTDGVSSPAPEGRSFHHGRFVMKLRAAAMAEPNVTVVETTATSLITAPDSTQVIGVECAANGGQDGDGGTRHYYAPLTVAADGYASKLRKEHHPYTPQVKSKFWALELIDAELPMPYHGHVVLGDGPPVLLYQIGTHETRVLVDIPENLPSASVQNGGVKGHLRNTVLPALPACVQPSFRAAIENGRLRSMPNSFLPPATNRTPGLVILGDALNMRHPLTGGGMTVAFNDVVVLRDLLSPEKVPDLSDTRKVLRQMSAFHWQRKSFSSVINILAQALYSLFAAEDERLKTLKHGCFRYFQLGRIDGPVGLLAGLIRRPFVLFGHFFSVAFLSIWILLREEPLYRLPVTLAHSLAVLWTSCVVIFPYIFAEMKS